MDPVVSAWIVTPLLIFSARILDVSVGTLRIILLNRGQRRIAPILGFFEILIWLTAIRQIFQHLDNPAAFVAYAGGFAAGTYVGMFLESKLAIGLLAVRIITRSDATDLMDELNQADFGVTSFAAEGVNGSVRLLFTIIQRRDLERVRRIVDELHPRAFVSISDVRSASEGIFPESRFRIGGEAYPGFLRKSK